MSKDKKEVKKEMKKEKPSMNKDAKVRMGKRMTRCGK